jgi:FkbM family methyltransferase
MALEVVADHLIWPAALPEGARIVDCGANVGEFSRAMVRRFNASCIALEPVAAHYAQIGSPIVAMQVAMGANCGRRTFGVSENPLESGFLSTGSDETTTIEVDTITLSALMSNLGWQYADLVKMDIEGAEIEVLDGCSDDTLAAIGQWTIEFHDFNRLVPVADVKRLISRMRSLGFCEFSRFRGCYYDTLFINLNKHTLRPHDRIKERLRLLSWGVGRRLRAWRKPGGSATGLRTNQNP